MASTITLRPIEKKDLEWTRNLRNANRAHFFDSRQISPISHALWFNLRKDPFFIIERDDIRLGTIALRKIEKGHEIHNVLIDQAYRKKGVLKQVMKMIEKRYSPPFFVDVIASNDDAVRIYEKLGFSPYAIRMKKK